MNQDKKLEVAAASTEATGADASAGAKKPAEKKTLKSAVKSSAPKSDAKSDAKTDKVSVSKVVDAKTDVAKTNTRSFARKTTDDRPARTGAKFGGGDKNTRFNRSANRDENRDNLSHGYSLERKEKVESISTVYTRPVDALGRGYGTGRGKGHSVARVWVKYNNSGVNKIIVNDVDAIEYFKRDSLVKQVESTISAAFNESSDAVHVEVNIDTYGGGISGQARACKLGLARALVVLNKTLQPNLREGGFLTRDARVPERQKPGQPGARKQYPYNRR